MPPKTTKKAGVAKKKKKSAAAARRVIVRMFRQGLGDCFLITIPQGGSKAYHILIDCGVAMNTPRAEVNMKKVVSEIHALTGGVVDLLVVTHEHWDHVSGFVQAGAELAKIRFRHLWLGWTENRRDGLAKELRDEFTKAKLALARAAEMASGLAVADVESSRRLQALDGVMSFMGLSAAAAAGQPGVEDAMAVPRKLVPKESTEYLKPGHTCRLPGSTSGLAAGIEAIVLGPPHSREQLIRIDPSTKAPETYEKKKGDPPGLAMNWAWSTGVTHHARAAGAPAETLDAGLPEVLFDRSQPFDSRRGLDFDAAKGDAFFADRYFRDDPEINARRIDGDWLWNGAQRLALRMDKYTNNTSLVLAFELPTSKDVLLFVADAQVGNWLSWHDRPYTTTDGRSVTASDLLARTRLYKVGHHGSHNATLKERGLELMTHPELVAMLPVDADGVKRLGYGQMPLRSLVAELKERTSGRLLRVDEDWDDGHSPGIWNPGAAAREAKRTISVGDAAAPTERTLYLEFAVEDRP
jgi:hypothetical protein